MKIEFFGGAMDGETRDTDILYPGNPNPNPESIGKMKCVVKGDGVYRAKQMKGRWVMAYTGKEDGNKH